MLTRFHKLLIGLLVVQLGLAVVMLTRDDDATAAKPQPLLAGFDAAKVTRLLVSSPQSKAPIDLVKRGDGWVLASHFDHPVAESKVNDVLGPLAKMAAAGPMATSPSRHKQLRVADDDHERKLIVTADGKEQTILLGGPAGSRRTAVRLGHEGRVFAVQGISAWTAGLEPRHWIDTGYVKVPREEVTKVTLQRGPTTLELARASATEPWSASFDGKPLRLAAGETLDTTAIDSAIGAATTIELAEPGDPKRDASAPTATLTIERAATGNTTVAPVIVDLIADGDRYWVRQRGVERAGLVDKARLANLIDLAPDKLVKKEAPAGTASPPATGN